MYVCICNALRETDVRRAIDEGAGCAARVFAANGCRTRCGSCVDHVKDMIRTTRPGPEPAVSPEPAVHPGLSTGRLGLAAT